MGSASDLDHCGKIAAACEKLGIESVQRIGSAHKVPMYAAEMLAGYEASDRPVVYITVAGRSNALSGFTDGAVQSPVIACPPYSSSFGGADIYSSLRMPSGVAPATVLEPGNAALLAAKIFGLTNPEIRANVAALQKENQEKLYKADADLN